MGDASPRAETWVAVQGGMAREKIKPKARHEYADAHGVPPVGGTTSRKRG
jgi:hypothetical protein